MENTRPLGRMVVIVLYDTCSFTDMDTCKVTSSDDWSTVFLKTMITGSILLVGTSCKLSRIYHAFCPIPIPTYSCLIPLVPRFLGFLCFPWFLVLTLPLVPLAPWVPLIPLVPGVPPIPLILQVPLVPWFPWFL